MTTKDYIYLGLILLTALAFYCNGFYAGVYRCKKVYDSMANEPETDSDNPMTPPEPAKSVAIDDKAFASPAAREPAILLSSHDLRGDFRNN
jgi:hypothetical protein